MPCRRCTAVWSSCSMSVTSCRSRQAKQMLRSRQSCSSSTHSTDRPCRYAPHVALPSSAPADSYSLWQNSPQLGGSRISPVPSPPHPGSPNAQSAVTGPEMAPSSLDQRLQRLQLQRSPASPTAPAHSSGGVAYSSLLAHSSPHQRSSPPPNFVLQNLHSIREDSGDSGDNIAMEASMSVLDEKGTKKANPQISITDAHGHVVPVHSSLDSDDDSKAAMTAACPAADDGSPSSPSAFRWRPPFGLQSMLSQYPGFNLASIPPVDPHSFVSGGTNLYNASVPFGLLSGGPGSPQKQSPQHHRKVPPPQMPFSRCSTEASIFTYPNSMGRPPAEPMAPVRGSGSSNVLEQAMAMCSNYNGLQDGEALLTQRTMSELLLHIKHVLDERSPDLMYQHMAENLFRLQCANLQMEMEICQRNDSQRGLKFRLIQGENSHYDKLRNELLSCMDLWYCVRICVCEGSSGR